MTDAADLIDEGNQLFLEGKLDASLSFYKKALAIAPGYLTANLNLANTYFELKNYESCILHCLSALQTDSNNLMALTLLGSAHLEKGSYKESIEYLNQALAVDSQSFWLQNYLSQAYQKSGDFKRALEAGWQAVELSNGEDSQHINFSYLLYEISLEKSLSFVKKYAQNWLQNYASNPIVNYMANAVLGNEKISKADSLYVENIFDVFAADFETVLCGLNYRVPQIFEQILEDYFKDSFSQKLRILDAGCGTGFCGLFLQKYALPGELYGVDLSAKMLEIAAAKNCYGSLQKEDLLDTLECQKKYFDLITAADVLTYFGSLENAFAKFADSLKPNGLILFSVSLNNANKNDYFLHCSGRFLHREKYLDSLLEKYHFSVLKKLKTNLREEGGKSVVGLVFLAQRQ